MENRSEIETIEPIIDKVNYIIDESIIQLKELSHNLSPHILTNHGIDPAISDFISRIAGNELNLDYESKLNGRFSNGIETGIYRVVTELITNTIKHANATHVSILIFEKDDHIQLHYSDNGCGFDVTSMLKSSSGSGLYNIINRMKAIDATYRFESDLGKGFSFYANIKIK